jgi:hypothetical protein
MQKGFGSFSLEIEKRENKNQLSHVTNTEAKTAFLEDKREFVYKEGMRIFERFSDKDGEKL